MSTSPDSRSSHTTDRSHKGDINAIARVLLAGVLLPSGSPFSILSTCPEVVETIYGHVRDAWRACITRGYDGLTIDRFGNLRACFGALSPSELSRVALCRLQDQALGFPEPAGLACDMLPFASDDFSTIPREYRGYLDFIAACQAYVQPGGVWYLTIHESETTRAPGIRVEGCLAAPAESAAVPGPAWHHCGAGAGLGDASFVGGVFQVCNIDDSTRMWNAQVARPPSVAPGLGCDVEHFRGVLDELVEPVYPRANQLFWLTGATPHESLPLEEGTCRQYFKLVTSELSAWWEEHYTKNRLGAQPGCTVFKHSTFGKDADLGFRDHSRDEKEEISPPNK